MRAGFRALRELASQSRPESWRRSVAHASACRRGLQPTLWSFYILAAAGVADVAQALLPAASRVCTGHMLYITYQAHREHFWGIMFEDLCPGRNTVLWKSAFVLWRNGTAAIGAWPNCAGATA